MENKARVILKDGTVHLGRLFMILTATPASGYSKKCRKIICLEVGESKTVLRIDDSNIEELAAYSHDGH